MKKLFFGRLTYHDPHAPFAPATFYGISTKKEELEQWALETWNSVMPTNKQETFEELVKHIKNRQGYSEWSLYEQVPGEIQLKLIL